MSDGLTRDVQLRLSVKNNTQQDFKALTDQVNALTAAITKETAAAATGAIKQAELAESLNKLKEAGKGIEQLAKDIQAYQNSFTQIDAASKKVETAAAKLKEFEESGSRNQRRLQGLQNAYNAATKSLENLTTQQAALATGLNNAGINTEDLTGEMTRLLAVADKAGAGIRTLDTAINSYTKNVREYNAEVKRQKEEQEKAARAAELLATATKKLADETERAKQAQGLAGVQAGTAALTAQRDAAEKQRKAEEEFQAASKKGLEDIRNARYADIKNNLEAANKAKEKEIQDEKARNDEMEKLRRQALAGLAQINARHDAEQMERTRQNIEERNRRISNQNIVEREEARRTSLGIMGRFREDTQARIDGYKREREARQAVNAGRSAGGLLGLPAYQVTNLGYQITDIVQGGLSGVSPGVIAAQQGPQIVQIFGLGILKWTPIIVAGLGAISVAVGALQRTFREQASNREFSALLTQNSQAIGYAADQLTALRKEARDMGMSWTEAGQAIKTAIDANIRGDRLKEFLQTAQNVSDVTGKSVPDAMKELTAAFSGSAEELLKLNDAYHFLDRTGQQHIRQLLEEGKTEQARAEALEKFSSVMAARAKEALSPWTIALRDVSKAWDDFLITVGNTQVFKDASQWLIQLAKDAKDLARTIDDIVQNKPGARQSLYDYVLEQLFGSDWRAAKRLDEWAKEKLGIRDVPVATAAIPAPGQTTTSATAADAAVASRFTNPRNLKLDGGDLRELANLIAEAAKSLPPGYTVEAISTERLGATVRGTGRPSEHGFDRAIDVRIVDASGKPVPGSMGAGGPIYSALDEAIKKAAAAGGVPIAIGSTFNDAGHYSIRGREAINNEARRGVTGGATSEQVRVGQELVAQAEKQRAIDTARTIELERQARYRQAEAEINQRAIDDASKEVLKREARAKIDQDLFFKQKQLEQTREDEKITFARHYYEVVEAGEKAVQEAIKTQNLSWEQQERIRTEAMQRENTRLTQIDQQNKAFDAAVKSTNDWLRALRGGFGPDMEGRLAALSASIDDRVKQLQEARAAATLTDRGRYDPVIADVQRARPIAEFEERGKVLQEQARDAVNAREALIAANKAAREAGAISISEQQERDKKAFELTKTAIDDATAALDKWIETGKELGAPTIKLEQTRSEIQKLRVESEHIDPLWKGLIKTAEDSFGNRAVEAFDSVAESIGKAIAKTEEWRDVWKDMGRAAANFFAGILKDLAAYVIKAELAKVMSSFIPSLSGFGGGATAAGISSQIGAVGVTSATSTGLSSGWASIFSGAAAVVHEGGVIGQTSLPRRSVPQYWFDNAPRFHNGGLAANEQAAILQNGEEVLTANNPRHISNYGGGGGGEINIRNVLVADPEFVPSHMASARGEKIIMSTLTKNAATVRQLVR